jgi:hypothetical protein
MSSSADRTKIIVGAYVLLAAAQLFMGFAASIRTALQTDEGSPSVLKAPPPERRSSSCHSC